VSRAPLIVDIKANSLDDGPGIRSVVFFKGCPLSCVWCHNPESIAPQAELSYDPSLCVDAGGCAADCPEDAIQLGRVPFIDRERCTACMDCVDGCPSGALSRVGDEVFLDALVERLLRDKPFFEHSGGGVTLSGGEATWSMEFAGELARRLHEAGVHTLLQTCGAFGRERFQSEVEPWLDLIHYDLKVADPELHRSVCGVDNRAILGNFGWLMRRSRTGGADVLPRVPLVPGITDTNANLDALADVLVRDGAVRVQLMPYNPLWGDKAVKLGKAPAFERRWMEPVEIARCAERFEARGLEAVL
jgi:pyruvate formate lyase activating enzyme